MKLSISARIGFILPLAVVGMGSMLGISYWATSASRVMEVKEQVATHRFELVSALEVQFLQSRRREKDFLLRNDIKLAGDVRKISETITADLANLKATLIRRLADFDSLAFPKRGESESLSQTGGLRCDQGFHYVPILMEKVFGGGRGGRRTQPRHDVCWRSRRSTMVARVPMPRG